MNNRVVLCFILIWLLLHSSYSLAQDNESIKQIRDNETTNNITKFLDHFLNDVFYLSNNTKDFILNKLFNLNQFFTGKDYLFSGIIGALITIIPTWLIARKNHQKAIDKEAMKQHFIDLKNNIISKLIYILHNNPDQFPSLKKVKDSEILTECYIEPLITDVNDETIHQKERIILNGYLCRDFLSSHYPKVKQYWYSFCSILEIKQQNYNKLFNSLKKEIESIPIVEENRDIKIELLIQLLFILFNKREIQCTFEIKMLNNKKYVLFLKSKNESFESINQELFETEDEQLCSNIKKILNESINIILSNNEYIVEYIESLKSYDNSLKSFIRILDILMLKTNLMNEKKHLKIKCNLIKPQL